MEPFKTNTWENAQVRVNMEPYTKLIALDAEQQQTLDDWMKGPQVELYRELDDSADFVMHCRDQQGRPVVTRISDWISINGVRWNLVPGYNVVPKPVAQFIRQMKEDKMQLIQNAKQRASNMREIANY